MGTNYYAIPKATEQEKEKIIEAVKNDDWGTVLNLTPTRIHIGKSSFGWKFLFNHNDWDFYTAATMKEFINGSVIQDEYGQTIEPVNFWSLVETKQKMKSSSYTITENGFEYCDVSTFS